MTLVDAIAAAVDYSTSAPLTEADVAAATRSVLDVLRAHRAAVIEHLGGQPTGQHMCSGQILHPNNEPCDDCMAVFVFPKGDDE